MGYGLLDIPIKNRSWILLNWKVKIFKRPKYAETLCIKTWASKMDKLYAIREFEIFNEERKLIGIATSKWVCIDTKNKTLIRVDNKMKDAYTIEPRVVFNDEIEKLKEPDNYIDECSIKINKTMIDVNGHVHNLNHIDFASQILPFEVMQEANSIEVMYKKEIKENDIVRCFYYKNENFNYVTIKSEDLKNLHAIIRLGIN